MKLDREKERLFIAFINISKPNIVYTQKLIVYIYGAWNNTEKVLRASKNEEQKKY